MEIYYLNLIYLISTGCQCYTDGIRVYIQLLFTLKESRFNLLQKAQQGQPITRPGTSQEVRQITAMQNC